MKGSGWDSSPLALSFHLLRCLQLVVSVVASILQVRKVVRIVQILGSTGVSVSGKPQERNSEFLNVKVFKRLAFSSCRTNASLLARRQTCTCRFCQEAQVSLQIQNSCDSCRRHYRSEVTAPQLDFRENALVSAVKQDCHKTEDFLQKNAPQTSKLHKFLFY